MKPCRFEGEICNLEVHGEIPHEIDGTFYRVMPDPQLPPFVENDPVRRPVLIDLPMTVGNSLISIIVVQRRRKYQRVSNQGWALPL